MEVQFSNRAGEVAQEHDFVFANTEPTKIEKKADGARRFSGVGYTGKMIEGHYYWGRVMFDLSTMEVPAKMPILLNHDATQIVGFSDAFDTKLSEGLKLEGVLSSATECGRNVAALSDEGFPWQMSVRISPKRIEEVKEGASVVCNGQTVEGPCYVFRDSKLSETSFTPIGWDSGTSATALSRLIQKEDSEMSKALEDRIAQLETDLQASNTTITDLRGELAKRDAADAEQKSFARVQRVKDAYAKATKELTDEDAAKFANMDDTAIDAIVTALSFAVPANTTTQLPANLFSHQATGDATDDASTDTFSKAFLRRCEQAGGSK